MAIKDGIRLRRKGSATDIIFVMVILLVLSMSLLIGFRIVSGINDQVQGMDMITAEGKAASTQITGFFPGVIDNSFILIVIFLIIGVLILASLVRIHPIFIPVYIIAMIFFIFLSAVFSNVYQEMAANTELIAYANQLTVISHVMIYLPIIIGVLSTILMIIMYKTWQSAQ